MRQIGSIFRTEKRGLPSGKTAEVRHFGSIFPTAEKREVRHFGSIFPPHFRPRNPPQTARREGQKRPVSAPGNPSQIPSVEAPFSRPAGRGLGDLKKGFRGGEKMPLRRGKNPAFRGRNSALRKPEKRFSGRFFTRFWGKKRPPDARRRGGGRVGEGLKSVRCFQKATYLSHFEETVSPKDATYLSYFVVTC